MHVSKSYLITIKHRHPQKKEEDSPLRRHDDILQKKYPFLSKETFTLSSSFHAGGMQARGVTGINFP